MCIGCWEEYEEDICELTPHAVAAVKALYEVHSTGGKMHVIVDDWNVGKPTIDWALTKYSAEMDVLELRVLAFFARMSKNQRATVLAIVDRYVD